jgi:ABC-type transporter Mla MlaB component
MSESERWADAAWEEAIKMLEKRETKIQKLNDEIEQLRAECLRLQHAEAEAIAVLINVEEREAKLRAENEQLRTENEQLLERLRDHYLSNK